MATRQGRQLPGLQSGARAPGKPTPKTPPVDENKDSRAPPDIPKKSTKVAAATALHTASPAAATTPPAAATAPAPAAQPKLRTTTNAPPPAAAVAAATAAVVAAPAPMTPEEEEALKQAKKRINVVKEIMATETSYVEQLNIIVDLYYNPLVAMASKNKDKSVMTMEEIQTVFSNIAIIQGINTNFLNSLRERIAEAQPDERNALVGSVFNKLGPFFKMYTEYINNHPKAVQKLVTSLYKKDKVKNFLQLNERNASAKGLDIESLLITPVQRVPRYKLLLEVLIKCTDPAHPDYPEIDAALSLISKVATQINSAMKESQNRQDMLNIQKMFGKDIDLIAPSRKFVMKGVLTKKCRNSNKDFTFFLFTDLLLYAHGGGLTQYVLHRKMEINSAFKVKDVPDRGDEKNVMEILSAQKSFVVYAEDGATKAMWMKAFAECEDDARKRTGASASADSKPIWLGDESSPNCLICLEEWTVLRRRHHCRRCGILVCADCSKGRTKNRDRICDRCVRDQMNVALNKKNEGSSVSTMSSHDLTSFVSADSKGDDEDENEEQDIDEIDFEQPPPSMATEGTLRFTATQTYYGSKDNGELDVSSGDPVEVQYSSQGDDGVVWWYGQNLSTAQSGWVNPAILEAQFDHVHGAHEIADQSEEVAAMPLDTNAMVQVVGVYTAIRPCKGRAEDETLSFNTGDIIDIHLTHESGYWFGSNRTTGLGGWCDPAYLEPANIL